jgi:hypothetical protein
MTRTRCAILLAIVAAALAATPAAAEARALKAGLPSAGDITLVHVKFERSAASARRLPRLRLASAATRRVLRRYRVAVIGGSFRLSRKQVVGSVLMMRKRGGRVSRTPRAAAARIAANAPVASVTVERNAIADLRRERARASGEEANAPTACGETGLFTLLSGDTLPPGNFSFDLYYNNWDQLIDFGDPAVERDKLAELLRLTELGYGLACGQTARLDPDAQLSLDDFIKSLGATPPGPDCGIITTYVGPATDGEGHILTQPLVNVSLRCSATINGVTITLPEHMPIRCSDSAGHDCTIQGPMALFPFTVPAFEDRSYGVTADPPLERGDPLDIWIESDRGDLREHAVM